MIRVAIYARYSSNNQREESITAQLRACQAYCKRKKYTVIHEYADEAKTGRNDDRPGYQAMLRDAQAGRFTVLVCHKLDRAGRDEYDYYFNKAKLQKAGVRQEYAEQSIDNSPEGQMMESMLVGMAAYYSRNLAREAKKGMKENAYQAKHNGGKPPLGYAVVGGKYVLNEKEAVIVRRIFELRAAGAGYTEIINDMTAKGYKTQKGRSFGKNSLHDLLKNKKYIGIYTFGRVATTADGTRNNHKDDGDMIEIPGGIPAIISDELWQAVQARIKADKRAPGAYKAKVLYLLSGRVRCDCCGSAMVGGTLTSKGHKYSYYKCTKANNEKICKNGRIKKEYLEDTVMDYLFGLVDTEEKKAALKEKIRTAVTTATDEHIAEEKNLLRRRDETMKKVTNYLVLVEDGQFDDIIYQRLTELKDSLTGLNQQLEDIDKKRADISFDFSQVDALSEIAKQKEKSPDKLRAVFHEFVQLVKVGQEDIKMSLSFEWWRRATTCQKTDKKPLIIASLTSKPSRIGKRESPAVILI